VSQTTSGSAHFLGANPVATNGPVSFGGWINSAAFTQWRRFMVLAKSGESGNGTNYLGIGTNLTAADGKLSGFAGSSVTNGQRTSAAAIGTSSWHATGVSFTSNNGTNLYLDGAKTSAGGGIIPSGINETVLSGRPSDFTSGWSGEGAHWYAFARVLNDLEWTYLHGGGNPRWLSPARYWKFDATQLATVTDEAGNENLTAVSSTAGADDPLLATYWTAAAFGNQSYTQGVAIATTNLASKFDKMAAAVDFTCSLKQLSAPGTPTTASSAGSASNILTVADASSFTAGGYCSVTNNSTPTLILALVGTTLLLATPRTWASSDNVYPFTVSAKTFTGLSVSTNSWSGTPAAGDVGTYANCLFRAANSTTATLLGDSPLFPITIAASGSAPSFSAGPTLSTANTDGYTFAATSNQTATWYAIALLKGSATPTGAQVKSGSPTGFVSRFSAALSSGVAGSLSLTGLTNPIYDIHQVVDNGSGTSAVSSSTALQKAPPAGKQYASIAIVSISAITKAAAAQITANGHGRATGDWVEIYGVAGMTQINGAFAPCTVINANTLTVPIDSTGFTTYTSGGQLSWGQSMYAGASTLPVTGDIGIWDQVTVEDGVPVTPTPSGAVAVQAGVVSRRQTFSVDFYSVAAQIVIGVTTDFFWDVPPLVPSTVAIPPGIFLPANQAISSTNVVTGFASDVQGDTLSVSFDVLPPGVVIDQQQAKGATGAAALFPATATYTNRAGDTSTAPVVWVVGPVMPPNLRGLSQGLIQQTLASLYLTPTFANQDDPDPAGPAPAGQAIAQNPPLGTPVQPNTSINISLSTGISSVTSNPPPPVTVVKSPQIQFEESAITVNNYRTDEAFGQVVMGASDPAGQVYRVCRVSAAARVTQLEICNDGNLSGTQYCFGAMYPNGGGLIVPRSDQILAPSVSLEIERPHWTDIYSPLALNTSVTGLVNVGKRLWELLGLSADPSPATKDLYYDVVVVAIAPGSSGGVLNVRLSGRLITSLRVP
jgi:hypothetical protein